MFTVDGYDFIFLPQGEGGFIRRRMDRLTDNERKFVELTKHLDLQRNPEHRTEYRKLVAELLNK